MNGRQVRGCLILSAGSAALAGLSASALAGPTQSSKTGIVLGKGAAGIQLSSLRPRS